MAQSLAVSVPSAAPHPEVAQAFFRFLVSAEGRAVLGQTGLLTVDPPEITGNPPPGLLP